MRTLGFFATACLVGLASAGGAYVQAQSSSAPDDFRVYCSMCHGVGAKGDGALAGSIGQRPPNLTTLALRNEGKYPTDLVSKRIDGREPGSAHGKSEMPAWGDVFAKSSGSGSADATTARIDALVRYLETMQARQAVQD
jgi:mono/diheme cytochrome c family protein